MGLPLVLVLIIIGLILLMAAYWVAPPPIRNWVYFAGSIFLLLGIVLALWSFLKTATV